MKIKYACSADELPADALVGKEVESDVPLFDFENEIWIELEDEEEEAE